MKLSSSALSDVGAVRTRNEDAVLVDESLGLFLLADGLGGHERGDEASAAVTLSLHFHLKKERESKPDKPADVLLLESLKHVNAEIHSGQAEKPHLSKMGSTLVVAWFSGSHLLVANVGDSRLYRLRKGKLRLLTRDHTLAEAALATGHTRRGTDIEQGYSRLLKVMGMHPDIEPDIGLERTKPGDRFLLASDGLSNELSSSEIESILAGAPSAEQAASALVKEALARRAKDNVSVIVVDVLDNSGEGFRLSRKTGPIRKSPVRAGLYLLLLTGTIFILLAAIFYRPRPKVTPPAPLDALLAGDYSTAADLFRGRFEKSRAGEERVAALLGLVTALWRLRDNETKSAVDMVFREAERARVDISPALWPLPPPPSLEELMKERALAAWKRQLRDRRLESADGTGDFKNTIVVREARELYVKHLKIGQAMKLLDTIPAAAHGERR